MRLAYTMAQGCGDTDLVLERLASDLAARGLRCCGTVQINSARADAGPCDMDVRVLPNGASGSGRAHAHPLAVYQYRG